jgi:hypothetical protein
LIRQTMLHGRAGRRFEGQTRRAASVGVKRPMLSIDNRPVMTIVMLDR